MKIEVPTCWGDVTVGEYQQVASLDVNESPKKRLANIVSILCNINAYELEAKPLNEIQQALLFMNEDISKDRFSSITVDGVEYEWIKSINEITLGEEISIEQTIEVEQLNYAQSFDLVMSVLLQPKGEKFDAKKIKERRELFSKFPIDKVYGMILFFLNGGHLYSKTMKEYLVVPKQKKRETIGQKKRERLMKRLKRKVLVVVLNGLHLLTGWHRTILLNMN